MAIVFTTDGVVNMGSVRLVHGTFTSESGDNTAVFGKTTGAKHGLDTVIFHQIDLVPGGVEVPSTKLTINDPTITATWMNTHGLSGRWSMIGR